ncbi:MAG: hypothetical protein ACMUEL_04705 [Flavobacteriales bacterium Tduv]
MNYIWNVLPEGSEFFKRLKTFIHGEGMEKEIRKIYQKGQGIKDQSAYSGILLFKIILLSHCYKHQ